MIRSVLAVARREWRVQLGSALGWSVMAAFAALAGTVFAVAVFRGGAAGKDENGKDLFSGGLVSGAGAAGLFGANFDALRSSTDLLSTVKALGPAWPLERPPHLPTGRIGNPVLCLARRAASDADRPTA